MSHKGVRATRVIRIQSNNARSVSSVFAMICVHSVIDMTNGHYSQHEVNPFMSDMWDGRYSAG